MKNILETVVIGAGQAGLATGYHLQQAGVDFAILEANETAGGAWGNYYDSLELFSPAGYSSLPGMPFPHDPHRYPRRDEVVGYLAAYAERFRLPIRTGVRVARVSREGVLFCLEVAGGETVWAQTVVVATGSFGNPHWPVLEGQADFVGQVSHAADYRQPAPLAGQRVVVVGGGNTAVQIAVELAQAADVTLASRQPIRFAPQRIGRRDVHFWLTGSGLDQLPVGQWLGVKVTEAVLDRGRYRAALGQQRPERRPMFSRFWREGVVWADGQEERVDHVIYATGYRPQVPFLAEWGGGKAAEYPHQKGGISQLVAGLYFVGLPWQRSHRSATLRGVGPDAEYVVRHLRAYQQQLQLGAVAYER